MFGNRIFKTSLLISASAHLLAFLLVGPEIRVGSFSYASFPKVDFVNVSLSRIFLKENLPDLNKIDPTYDFFRRKLSALDILPQAVGFKQAEKAPQPDYIEVTPVFNKVDFSLPEYENLQISGDLKKRLLISSPDLPEIPVWFVEKIAGPLEIETWVGVKGDVIFCQRVISSGSYTLDMMGINYVRNFKFAPHPGLTRGRIKVLFKGSSNDKIRIAN